MLVASGIEMLGFSVHLAAGQSTIHPTLIWDRHESILVDTGYPGMLEKLLAALSELGVTMPKKIIITHHDIDHIGCLSAILAASPVKIEVLCQEQEKEFVQGERAPIKASGMKMEKLGEQLDSLNEAHREAIKKIFANFKDLASPVDKTLAKNELLPFCGGITVIHTPGHTPGHISLYLQESKTLIAGDALFVEDGILVPAPEFLNFDPPQAKLSLKKFLAFDIKRVICYHGGLYSHDVNKRILELTAG